MVKSTFIIGGCRCGKSSHALQVAESVPGRRKLFIATCVPQDEEMKTRVGRHQADRGPRWRALEEPVNLAQAVAANQDTADVMLIDCLTLWLSNLMLANQTDEALYDHVDGLCGAVEKTACPVILVSNEVGAGIVPENALARRYRDLVGRMNQRMAAVSQRVIWMVAGIPVPIKTQIE